MYYISIVCNICLFFGIFFLVNYTIIGWFFINRMQNQKNIPFWPRVHYIYVSNIGPCTFFLQKKERKRNAMKSLRKVLFSFLISKCIDSFCHECRIPRWKKSKRKTKRILELKKQKLFFFHIFFFELLSSLDLWSNINYNQFVHSKIFCTNITMS